MNECGGGGTTPIHSPRRPPPWQHSFQFSPRFSLITLTSLRLPLSSALIRYPLHFTPFYLSFPLFVSPFLSLYPLSFSVLLIVRGFKRLSIWEWWVSGLWVFIPMTETCWRLLIQNERFAHFFLFKGDDKEWCLAHKSEKVTHDTFCLLLSKVIIFLFPIQPCRSIFFISISWEPSRVWLVIRIKIEKMIMKLQLDILNGELLQYCTDIWLY